MPGKTRTCQRCKGLFKKWEFPEDMGHGRWICKTCYDAPRAQITRWGATDPGWRRNAEYRRLEVTYGLSSKDFDDMLVKSCGRCEICDTAFEGATHKSKTEPFIDHCHATGKVRGLLCAHCNTTLGMVKDSIGYMRQMAVYLKRFSPPTQR